MGKRKHTSVSKDLDNLNECDELQIEEVAEKRLCLENVSSDIKPISIPNNIDVANTPVVENTATCNDVGRPLQPIQQLRTSIRVQNKQKREESKDLLSLCESSSRKIDGSSQDEEEEETIGAESGGEKKKRRRAWELWSMEDKNAFFEAINECGKDFEAIQNYLKKSRKKDPSYVGKNKDQIRHFYYRTWHKISKHIKFSDELKKATQELYALINYGELRKKIGSTLDEKKAQKLQELIEKGSSSMKVKGKSIRVKTPICRALKKLNEVQDDREQMGVRVPLTITLEVVAATIASFWYVQGLAHNPRLRIQCSPQTPLSRILDLLENKWKSSEMKICERLAGTPNFPNVSISFTKPVLHLQPSHDAEIRMFNVQLDPFVSSSAVSLISHEEFLRKKVASGILTPKQKKRKSLKQKKDSNIIRKTFDLKSTDAEEKVYENSLPELNTKDDDGSDGELDDSPTQTTSCPNVGNDSDDEITVISSFLPSGDLKPKIKEEPVEYSEPEINCLDSDATVKKEGEEGEPTNILHQLRALETIANTQTAKDDADVIYIGEKTRLSAQIQSESETEKSKSPEEDPPKEEPASVTPNLDSLLSSVRKGWTTKTCGNVTLGELYLMFGKKKKIKLEFEYRNLDGSPYGPNFSQIPPFPNSSESHTNSQSQDQVTPESTSHSYADLSEQSSAHSLFGNSQGSKILSSSKDASAFQSQDQVKNNLDNTYRASSDSFEQNLVVPVPSGSSSQNETKDESDKVVFKQSEISSMLLKLLQITKDIYLKSNSIDGCICGSNGYTKGLTSKARSPASSRFSNTLGRSPGSVRSPRVKANARSPKICSPGPLPNSPSNSAISSRAKPERLKPASAKKLLPDIPEEALALPVIAPIPSNNSTPGTSKELNLDKQQNPIVTTITASACTTTTVEATVPEFRVPIGPAPRNIVQSQNNFGTQVNKLRQSRPMRRPLLKNMVVQRQLSLLPKLPQSTNIEGISFIANPVITTPPINTNNPLPLDGGALSQSVPKPMIVQPIGVTMPHKSSTRGNTDVLSASNSISVNVSGQHLMTVTMPTLQPSRAEPPRIPSLPSKSQTLTIGQLPSCISTAASSIASVDLNASPQEIGGPSTSILNTLTSCALPITANIGSSQSDTGKNTSSQFSEDFTNYGNLSTPPCTPRPDNDSTDEETSMFRTSTERSLLNLTPPPADIENSSSVLNTPKQLIPGSNINISAISPIKLNLSSLLSSALSPIKETPPLVSTEPPSPADTSLIMPPEIQLPSGSESLPILDISMGGTVSIRDQAESVIPDLLCVNPYPSTTSSNTVNLSVTCVTKNITTPRLVEEENTPSVNAVSAFGENSTDKLMDITLGSSNSNSNFSTLLAAAVQTPLEMNSENSNSFLQTPQKLTMSQMTPNALSKSDVKANLNFGSEFSSLNTSLSSPPASPSRFLHQADQAWLQNEVSDFSLSSLLGSLESPSKQGSGLSQAAFQSNLPSLSNSSLGGLLDQLKEDSSSVPMSLETLQRSHNLITMISDNSVDFAAAFAKMKAKVPKEK